jgi:hypothetical protein
MPNEWWELIQLIVNALFLIAWWVQHRGHG